MNRTKALRGWLWSAESNITTAARLKGHWLYRTPDLGLLYHYRSLIAELAETIIPRAGTPGAKDAGVPELIITMIKEGTPVGAQHRFLQGLEELAAYARSQYGQSFFDCSVEQRHNILAHFEKRDRPMRGIAGKVFRRLFGDAFFVTLKKCTVTGYCACLQRAAKQT
ncbi:gluconate 2-dehydrogenase subunit 3 family protein [uncultured Chitinophaga sp.]|jgi:hypothetical protein|uniref:gluconate 2-dehydrogenase subunit 3 family protein n=1 Tax=uncultured Chitinophaga sp. TaxID=339340 RepID=UPI0026028810|nr:gluconate 2-dehydrogenase subunit 3 family protein [uncultured Chitinophaga sp.]